MVNIFGLNITTELITSNSYFQRAYSIIGADYFLLLMLTVGLFIYAIFVWKFYKSLSKRDLFKIDLEKYELQDSEWGRLKTVWSGFLYVLEYLVLFPLYISFWFGLLSLFLFVMAKEIAVHQIILISIVIISTTRLTSYFKEELAADLAKLLPFVLLAILFTNPLFFSTDLIYARLLEVPIAIPLILDYFVFTIILEWILRLLYTLKIGIFGSEEEVEQPAV